MRIPQGSARSWMLPAKAASALTTRSPTRRYLRRHSPAADARAVQAFLATVAQLPRMPGLGRVRLLHGAPDLEAELEA